MPTQRNIWCFAVCFGPGHCGFTVWVYQSTEHFTFPNELHYCQVWREDVVVHLVRGSELQGPVPRIHNTVLAGVLAEQGLSALRGTGGAGRGCHLRCVN
jgi:hypothetical protein